MERDQEDLDLASFTVQAKSWPFLFQSHKDWGKISKPIQTLRTWYSRLLWSQRTNRSEKNLKYVSITSKCEHDDGRSVERTPRASHQQFSWGHSKDLIEGHDVIQKIRPSHLNSLSSKLQLLAPFKQSPGRFLVKATKVEKKYQNRFKPEDLAQ